jgi:hypothetical protein
VLFGFYIPLIHLIVIYLHNIIVRILRLIILTEYQFLFFVEFLKGDLLCWKD